MEAHLAVLQSMEQGTPITEEWLKKAKFEAHWQHYRRQVQFPYRGVVIYLVAQKMPKGWMITLEVNGLCASASKYTVEEVHILHKAIKG